LPSTNPRVNVTLSPEQYALLTRLSKVQQRSRSAVLLELLEIVTPVLERVVVAVEAAQRAQVQATEGLRESVEAAEAAILPHVSSAMGQLDLLVEAAVRAQDGPLHPMAAPLRSAVPRKSSSPRPVTRGPGRGAKGPGKRPSKGRAPTRKRSVR
jgi:predicted DNA-binding protein